MPITPIFLFSLPRSGSTLLQRLLAGHPEIHTTAEPWVLLPLLFTLRDRGVEAVYGHEWLRVAVDDLIRELPHGRADYLEALAGGARDLYARASPPEARYFLDKTPRYHLVVDEIAEAFPDAPLIFLWRHPLAVAASVMTTWARPAGRWNLFRARIDLYEGLDNLVRGYLRHRNRAVALRYEDLVCAPETTLGRVFHHVGLDPPIDASKRLAATVLPGRLGDHAGTQRYDQPDPSACDSWRAQLNNPLRRRWCRRYVVWIGRERLATMGYDPAAIRAEIDTMPGTLKYLGSDCLRVSYGRVHSFLERGLHGLGAAAGQAGRASSCDAMQHELAGPRHPKYGAR